MKVYHKPHIDYPDIKADEKRMEHLECLTSVLKELLGEEMVPNQSELMGIYGRLVVNGFNILDPEMNSVATGLYLGVSVTDHSCVPNAIVTFEGTTLFIRTLNDLPCLDWSKIFISYIDLMSTADDRRIELKSNYYFWCSCSKCIDEKESLEMLAAACPNQNCPEMVDLSNDKCFNCDEPIKIDRRTEFKEVMEFSKMHLLNMKEIACKTFVLCNSLLDSLNYLFFFCRFGCLPNFVETARINFTSFEYITR